MTGQPDESWLKFDVTSLTVTEPTDALAPTIVVPINGPFTLHADFTGSKLVWKWLTNLGIPWEAVFSAEGFGATATDYDFPVVPGNLVPGDDSYSVELLVGPGIPDAGIYQFTCLVRFPGCHGLTGFSGPLLIEVF